MQQQALLANVYASGAMVPGGKVEHRPAIRLEKRLRDNSVCNSKDKAHEVMQFEKVYIEMCTRLSVDADVGAKNRVKHSREWHTRKKYLHMQRQIGEQCEGGPPSCTSRIAASLGRSSCTMSGGQIGQQ
eukprot:4288645-Pleurochrysis_carterae.AAC.2